MNGLDPLLVGFTGCLMASFLLSELFNSIRYPRVLGYICAGIILGIPPVRDLIVPEGFESLLEFLSGIGIVFFLLLAGLELDLVRLRKTSTSALAVGLLSFFTPLTLGFCIMAALGYSMIVSFVMALCLSVTAAAIAVEILMEYGLLQTDDGAIVVGAGMIDDLLGVFALTVLLALVGTGGDIISWATVAVFSKLYLEYLTFFVAAYVIGFWVYPRLASYIWKEKSKNGIFTLSIIFGLTITILSQVFELSSMVGAFIAGVIINMTVARQKMGKEIVDDLTSVTFGLIIPFFFISIGFMFDISAIWGQLPLAIALLFVGALGKYGGVWIAGKLTGLCKRSIHTIGLGMNDRGGIELIIAMVALNQGLITEGLFSIIVGIAFITTFVSLYLFKIQIRKNVKATGALLDGELCSRSFDHSSLRDLA